MIFSNDIYCGDSAELLKNMEGEIVDCIITSPPYDDLRSYGKDPKYQFSFPFEDIAKELARVLKPGGVIVWVVGAQVVNKSETLTPFKQAIYFVEQCGLKLHDTMIYEKNSSSFPASVGDNRYTQVFEYMFVFSKGVPKFAKLICDKKNRWVGWKGFGKTKQRTREGDLVEYEKKEGTPEFSPRYNIWRFATGRGFTSSYVDAKEHPACFPESLVIDHLNTWTQEGDLVLDPFNGSGTTTAVAKEMKRDFIGIDSSSEYCKLAQKRLKHPIDIAKRIEQSKKYNNSRYPQDEQRKKV